MLPQAACQLATCVAGDPAACPAIVVPCDDLLSRPPAELHGEADVVQREEAVSQQLVLPYQVRQVGTSEARARLAGTLGVKRSEIPAVAGVLEVEATIGGQRCPVAGEAGREHAVEDVHPEGYDLQYPDRVPDPHEVPRPVGGELSCRDGERLQHLVAWLPDGEAADGVAGEPDLDRAVEALLPEIRI